MELTLSLDPALRWRIYCKAVEHGRTLDAEVLAMLDAGNDPVAADGPARLAAARAIRAQVAAA